MTGFKKVCLLLCVTAILFTGCNSSLPMQSAPPTASKIAAALTPSSEQTFRTTPSATPSPTPSLTPTASATIQPTPTNVNPVSARVHFLDVGQGDCILIVSDGHAMLIDAGTNAAGPDVLAYLKKAGISTLDYLIGTHPHEDHIGGMDLVLQKLNVKTVYMPKYSSNTQTFEDVLNAAADKNLKISAPKPGFQFIMGSCSFTVLAPIGEPKDANNASIVLRMTIGSVSMLFEGDAEAQSEQAMLASGRTLSCDLLKVAHHGSKTSSIQSFIQAVNPKYAVISCGLNNSYGLPDEETLTKLKNSTVYRTDHSGTIIAQTDGKNILIKTEK